MSFKALAVKIYRSKNQLGATPCLLRLPPSGVYRVKSKLHNNYLKLKKTNRLAYVK